MKPERSASGIYIVKDDQTRDELIIYTTTVHILYIIITLSVI